MSTPADLAATVREALVWVPDGYDQVDLDHEGPLRREATEALDRLAARVAELEAALRGTRERIAPDRQMCWCPDWQAEEWHADDDPEDLRHHPVCLAARAALDGPAQAEEQT